MKRMPIHIIHISVEFHIFINSNKNVKNVKFNHDIDWLSWTLDTSNLDQTVNALVNNNLEHVCDLDRTE